MLVMLIERNGEISKLRVRSCTFHPVSIDSTACPPLVSPTSVWTANIHHFVHAVLMGIVLAVSPPREFLSTYIAFSKPVDGQGNDRDRATLLT